MNGTKSEQEQIRRESDHFLRLIQIIFGLVLVQGITLNRELLLNLGDPTDILALLCLVTIFGTTVLSWMDFHRTMEKNPYLASSGLEKTRVAVDMIIVVAYAYVLFTIERIKGSPEANLTTYCLG